MTPRPDRPCGVRGRGRTTSRRYAVLRCTGITGWDQYLPNDRSVHGGWVVGHAMRVEKTRTSKWPTVDRVGGHHLSAPRHAPFGTPAPTSLLCFISRILSCSCSYSALFYTLHLPNLPLAYNWRSVTFHSHQMVMEQQSCVTWCDVL